MTNKDLEEALYIASHLQDFTEFKIREVIEDLVKEIKDSRIDNLMLEYCPDEMCAEQLDEWAKHQKPAEDCEGMELS